LTRYYRNSDLGKPRLIPLPGTGYPAEALNAALFAQFDTNKDGRLTPDEMARAAEVLSKLDANDDETLSPDELLPGFMPQQNQRPEDVDPETGMPVNKGPNTGAFFLATSGFDLAQQLLARF